MKTHQFVFAFGAVLSAFFVSAKTPLVGLPSKGVLSEKSQFNLFNPTPRELWRELSPDRPDVTESPITLDAGAYGLEVSLFDWRRNEAGDEAFTYLSTNFKIGLTNDIDIQFVFDAYSEEEPSTSGGLEGFSDLQIRLKYNLWGNDEEGTAFALFPYVKIPTGTELSNDEWEGGLILPFGTQLTEGVSLGLMAEFDIVFDDVEQEHELEFLHSAAFGFDLTDRVGLYLEYFGILGDEDYQAFASGGFTYAVNENLILDCGGQVGLNDAADETGAFLGFTTRF